MSRKHEFGGLTEILTDIARTQINDLAPLEFTAPELMTPEEIASEMKRIDIARTEIARIRSELENDYVPAFLKTQAE